MYINVKYSKFFVILLCVVTSSAFGGECDYKDPSAVLSSKIRVKTRSRHSQQQSPTSDLIERQKKQVQSEILKSRKEEKHLKQVEEHLKRHNHEGFGPSSYASSHSTSFSSSSLGLILEEDEEKTGDGTVASHLKEETEMRNTEQPSSNVTNPQQSALEEDKKLF